MGKARRGGKAARKALRERFLAWQCRIRQIAMREDGGRPSPFMQPRVLDSGGREIAASLTVLLLPKEPAQSTAFFRFQVTRSADPREIYERALTYLQADYFQDPQAFSDILLAVLPGDSPAASALIDQGRCTLEFVEPDGDYRLPCAVRALEAHEAARDAALWHNRMFNPALPDSVQILAFAPDWAKATVESLD